MDITAYLHSVTYSNYSTTSTYYPQSDTDIGGKMGS